jgi:hypothetical protein
MKDVKGNGRRMDGRCREKKGEEGRIDGGWKIERWVGEELKMDGRWKM